MKVNDDVIYMLPPRRALERPLPDLNRRVDDLGVRAVADAISVLEEDMENKNPRRFMHFLESRLAYPDLPLDDQLLLWMQIPADGIGQRMIEHQSPTPSMRVAPSTALLIGSDRTTVKLAPLGDVLSQIHSLTSFASFPAVPVADRYADLKTRIEQHNLQVIDDRSLGECLGSYRANERTLDITWHLTGAHQMSVLLHEFAHHCMWHQKWTDSYEWEFAVEACAFVVVKLLGFDASDYTFNYLAYHGPRGQSLRLIMKEIDACVIRMLTMLYPDTYESDF